MLATVYRAILRHDDSKLFIYGYIALAVVLAILLGLFWLTVVVGAHLLLELIKQHYYDPRPLPVIARSLWELKLDVGLVFAGLAIGLYLGVFMSAAGVGAAGRAGAHAAARVGLWQRGIRGLLITLDDVALVAKAKVKSLPVPHGAGEAAAGEANGGERNGDAGDAAPAAEPGAGLTPGDTQPSAAPDAGDVPAEADGTRWAAGANHWGGWAAPRWSVGDRLSIAFAVGSIVLILAAPLLTPHTVESTWAEIVHELRPFGND